MRGGGVYDKSLYKERSSRVEVYFERHASTINCEFRAPLPPAMARRTNYEESRV